MLSMSGLGLWMQKKLRATDIVVSSLLRVLTLCREGGNGDVPREADKKERQ